MRRLVLFACVLLVPLALPLSAQEEKQRWLPHNEGLQEKLTGVSIPLKSTDVFQERYDWGVTKKPHPRYGDPIIEAEIEEERSRNQAWAERWLKTLDELKLKGSVVETENFTLIWTTPRWKVGSSALNRVKAAHLYAERLEAVATRFQEIMGKLPGQRQTYWMLSSDKDCMRVTLTRFGGGSPNGMRLWGVAGQACTWPDRQREWNKDENYWSNAVHNGTQLLAQATGGFKKDLAAWMWVGLAHVIERETFGDVRNFDFQETGGGVDRWTVGGWPKKVLSAVNRSKEPSFAEIAAMDLDSFQGIHNVMAWSFVDFLVTEHPEALRKVFDGLKQHNDSAKAIDAALNLSTASFHDQWRAYVQRTYAERR